MSAGSAGRDDKSHLFFVSRFLLVGIRAIGLTNGSPIKETPRFTRKVAREARFSKLRWMGRRFVFMAVLYTRRTAFFHLHSEKSRLRVSPLAMPTAVNTDQNPNTSEAKY